LNPPERLRLRGWLRGRHGLPRPGEILLYPGGYSGIELLFPSGPTCFVSKLGQLAGNHLLTVTEGLANPGLLGEMTPGEGAQDIVFDHD
jgi:hypothetical protein